MKDILLKRNELKNKSVYLRSVKFSPDISDEQAKKVAKTQNEIYNKWKFYDKFVKAREEVKHEAKSNFMGKEE